MIKWGIVFLLIISIVYCETTMTAVVFNEGRLISLVGDLSRATFPTQNISSTLIRHHTLPSDGGRNPWMYSLVVKFRNEPDYESAYFSSYHIPDEALNTIGRIAEDNWRRWISAL